MQLNLEGQSRINRFSEGIEKSQYNCRDYFMVKQLINQGEKLDMTFVNEFHVSKQIFTKQQKTWSFVIEFSELVFQQIMIPSKRKEANLLKNYLIELQSNNKQIKSDETIKRFLDRTQKSQIVKNNSQIKKKKTQSNLKITIKGQDQHINLQIQKTDLLI